MRRVLACLPLAVTVTCGCAQLEPRPSELLVPAVMLPSNVAGIVDARQRFRQIVCSLAELRAEEYLGAPACDSVLTRTYGDQASGGAPAQPLTSLDTTLVFLPGIFGECVEHLAKPFSESYKRLRDAGFDVEYISLPGRSSSAANARYLNEQLKLAIHTANRLIVFGYSKGVTDFMEALAGYPDAEWVKRTAAFVSVAGVVAGSPIADQWSAFYSKLLATLPVEHCAPGDGGAVDSLTTEVRMRWLYEHSLPPHIAYYSLPAAPSSAPINPLLRPFQYELERWDSRNDGQVPAQYAVLPKSFLLGFANADHWSVALPFDRTSWVDAFPLAIGNTFPRDLILSAMMCFIAETIATDKERDRLH